MYLVFIRSVFYYDMKNILFLNTSMNVLLTQIRLINHDIYIHLFRSDRAQDNGK